MSVCVPAVPNIENNTINEDLDLKTFSQRGFKLDKNQTAVADTTLTTQAEIHHQYSNDDSPGHSGDSEEGQDHQYASEGNSSRGATGPDPQQLLEQPASQIDEIESDEEIRPYGIAAANSANSLYGQQPENITTARNGIEEDLGNLYGSCPATDE
ncbi:hypothetical protein Bbelb_040100 [Branchiostoma belcheri]|nr:hypothetical protein Bbelb_040100 [Branchiostoma belcheri]